jgi:hypothetical protein
MHSLLTEKREPKNSYSWHHFEMNQPHLVHHEPISLDWVVIFKWTIVTVFFRISQHNTVPVMLEQIKLILHAKFMSPSVMKTQVGKIMVPTTNCTNPATLAPHHPIANDNCHPNDLSCKVTCNPILTRTKVAMDPIMHQIHNNLKCRNTYYKFNNMSTTKQSTIVPM